MNPDLPDSTSDTRVPQGHKELEVGENTAAGWGRRIPWFRVLLGGPR